MRDMLGQHYESSNDELVAFLKLTKKDAPPMEPPFQPFGMAYKNITCLPDTRAVLNAQIMLDTKDMC